MNFDGKIPEWWAHACRLKFRWHLHGELAYTEHISVAQQTRRLLFFEPELSRTCSQYYSCRWLRKLPEEGSHNLRKVAIASGQARSNLLRVRKQGHVVTPIDSASFGIKGGFEGNCRDFHISISLIFPIINVAHLRTKKQCGAYGATRMRKEYLLYLFIFV